MQIDTEIDYLKSAVEEIFEKLIWAENRIDELAACIVLDQSGDITSMADYIADMQTENN